jgi:hypothetical protein
MVSPAAPPAPPVPPVSPPVSPVTQTSAAPVQRPGQAVSETANGRSSSAPDTDRAETGTGRKRPGGSPIFEEMASAWFRENWAATQGQGAGSAEPARKRSRAEERAAGHSRGKADADGGWDAGELLRPMPEPVDSGEVTIAGLPKRQPRSQLIPGGPSEQGSEPANVPARSAEQVRGRLSSYQQGVRQGRESRHRRVEVNGGGRHQHENHGEENS